MAPRKKKPLISDLDSRTILVNGESTNGHTPNHKINGSGKLADFVVTNGEASPFVSADQSTTTDRIEAAISRLGTLEAEIIAALFPMSGTAETCEAIAQRLGMCAQEVQSIADSALRDLRGSRFTVRRPIRTSSVWN